MADVPRSRREMALEHVLAIEEHASSLATHLRMDDALERCSALFRRECAELKATVTEVMHANDARLAGMESMLAQIIPSGNALVGANQVQGVITHSPPAPAEDRCPTDGEAESPEDPSEIKSIMGLQLKASELADDAVVVDCSHIACGCGATIKLERAYTIRRFEEHLALKCCSNNRALRARQVTSWHSKLYCAHFTDGHTA